MRKRIVSYYKSGNNISTAIGSNYDFTGHYEKMTIKEPFFNWVDSEKPTNTESVQLGDDDLKKIGIDPKNPSLLI